MCDGNKLLKLLLKASEKAANIARTCRQNESLFRILVQEKSEEEKNPRFVQDFKTLADVLIQETLKHDIISEFPELARMVKGEENNIFSNILGESITVEVRENCEETMELLSKVLDNDAETARILAEEVHRDISVSDVPVEGEIPETIDIGDIQDLAIWIDPIDSTADYIQGNETVDENTGIHLTGLRCVTVLIGVYSESNGSPILGVVNQPFRFEENSRWKGICYWGAVKSRMTSISEDRCTKNIVLISRSEDETIKKSLLEHDCTLVEAAGAGYKILSVALGYASSYVLTKGSTFKWDTCGPHAILLSLGGDIFEFQEFHRTGTTDNAAIPIRYSSIEPKSSNSNGLVAFRDTDSLEFLKKVFAEV